MVRACTGASRKNVEGTIHGVLVSFFLKKKGVSLKISVGQGHGALTLCIKRRVLYQI